MIVQLFEFLLPLLLLILLLFYVAKIDIILVIYETLS